MDVTGVLAVRLDQSPLQMKQELRIAPEQAVMPNAAKPSQPADSSHQAGYQRQQASERDRIELKDRRDELERPKIIPSLPDFKFQLMGAPKEEEFPAMPNSRAIEVIRRYDEMAQGRDGSDPPNDATVDIAA